ncbi:MAG TPA: hypothetical protein VJ692_15630 [Nitrospiraceae bacterium]|nr:hypothetical protein [Nitrospiraceae bacterium]
MTAEDAMGRALKKWLIIFVLVILGLGGAAYKAWGHDHSRPDLDGWFKALQSKKAGPCCDGSDAMRIDDPDWDNDGGRYRVRLEGEWVDVPENAVILEPNRAGHALVWPYRQNGKLNQIRCFMPGSLT